MDRNPSEPERIDWKNPITWISYLYTSFVYYLWLISSHLPHLPQPQRITDDKSTEQITRDAGIPRTEIVTRGDATQTVRQVAGLGDPAPKDSSLLPPSSSFVYCNNCLTPHSSQRTCSPAYVSTLSRQKSLTLLKKLKKPSSSASSTTTTTSSTVSFRAPSRASSTISDASTIRPSELIAIVPSGSHVLLRVPKLDWKTESIRIKRTRMSDWMDAEQRDVMRQFDEVIRSEEEDERTSRKRNGIFKDGSVRSIESLESRSRVSTRCDFEISTQK
nr:hypothetical protein C01F6.7 - Caenorhabditis elegans [Caenorhabditis elegans]